MKGRTRFGHSAILFVRRAIIDALIDHIVISRGAASGRIFFPADAVLAEIRGVR